MWQRLLKVADVSWIEGVRDIMRQYSEKTDGAFIEKKDSMIVWNYKDSDQDLAKWQAKELINQIEHIFSQLPIEVLQGKQCLEVIPKRVKRTKLVKRMIKKLAMKQPIDFILYIGDDMQNEKVYNFLNTLQRAKTGNKNLSDEVAIYPCTIGRRVTQANFFLSATESVLRLL